MELEELSRIAEDIVDIIDENKYPTIKSMLMDLVNEDYYLFDGDIMEYVDAIIEADNNEVLPPEVADMIIHVLYDEAENENAHALCALGSLYYTGRIGIQDYKTAYEFYERADKLGDRQAGENLGYCYYYGRMGEIDYKKAYHYFVKGALDGHIVSLYKIGDMYKNGYYVEKDEREAYLIYKYCLDTMNDDEEDIFGADIYIRLADCYYYGIGTNKKLKLALEYYQKAQAQYLIRVGNGDFMYKKQLDRAIENGDKVRKELLNSLPKYEWAKNNKDKESKDKKSKE